MNKYLIAGLGNIGEEYAYTRHNAGFLVADELAISLSKEENKTTLFRTDRLAMVNESRFKGKTLVIIKPTTYMNLSGKAINYWLQAEKIPVENLLVITDDLALPFGTLRLRKKGSDGGHNGLIDIINTLQSQDFARLRFGIGNEFAKGKQSDYVLGRWSGEEQQELKDITDRAVNIVKNFVTLGIDRTMTESNKVR